MSPNVRDISQELNEAEKKLQMGMLEEAKSLYGSILEADPHHAVALNKLGVIAAREQQFDEALKYFQRALAEDKGYAAPWSNIGNIYRERNQLDRAIEAYEQALRVDPDYHVAHHNLGVIYKQMGKVGKSIHHLKTATRLQRVSWQRESRQKLGTGGRRATQYLVYLIILVAIALLLLRR